jgi:hypothetical protein
MVTLVVTPALSGLQGLVNVRFLPTLSVALGVTNVSQPGSPVTVQGQVFIWFAEPVRLFAVIPQAASIIPEPASIILLGSGLAALLGAVRRRAQTRQA